MDDTSGAGTVLSVLEIPTFDELLERNVRTRSSRDRWSNGMRVAVIIGAASLLGSLFMCVDSLITRKISPLAHLVTIAAGALAGFGAHAAKESLNKRTAALKCAEAAALLAEGAYFKEVLPQAETAINERFKQLIDAIGGKMARVRKGIEEFGKKKVDVCTSSASEQEKERFSQLVSMWLQTAHQTENAYKFLLREITLRQKDAQQKLAGIQLYSQIIPATDDIEESLDKPALEQMSEVLHSIGDILLALDRKVKNMTEPKMAFKVTELEIEAEKFRVDSNADQKLLPPE